MSPIMQAQGLGFAYHAGAPVLRGVDLDLHAGQVVALLGPNGSGKSTLIRVLAGQLRADGSVRWDNLPIQRWNRRQLARRVAYLPQSPAWEPGQTVGEVLRLGRAPYWGAFGVESPNDAHVVDAIASLLDLQTLIDRPMEAISGGQRQRAFIARCLVQEPAAMLLDEPNTFLDLKHQVELGTLLIRLARQRGIAVLIASHDLNLSAAFADRMVLLSGGAVARSGTVPHVMDPALLSQVYGVAMERAQVAGRAIVVPVSYKLAAT